MRTVHHTAKWNFVSTFRHYPNANTNSHFVIYKFIRFRFRNIHSVSILVSSLDERGEFMQSKYLFRFSLQRHEHRHPVLSVLCRLKPSGIVVNRSNGFLYISCSWKARSRDWILNENFATQYELSKLVNFYLMCCGQRHWKRRIHLDLSHFSRIIACGFN